MSKISIKNLYKSFDNTKPLKNINFDIEEGAFVSLLGPSGCGKSTLLKVIAGLFDADSGEIYFDNKDFTNLETNKRNAIIVFQDYSLFPHLTVFENIAYGLKMRKMKKSEIKEKVEEMLEIVELIDKKDFLPRELSGGQQQRVAISRALVVRPRVLLLDEPFSGLDTNLKEVMKSFVLQMTKKFNITTLMVTHDKEEAFSMSDKVAVMLDGEIIQYDSPNNIYNSPKTLAIAKFLSIYNIIDGYVENNEFICSLGKYSTVIDSEKATMIINEEDIELNDTSHLKGEIVEKYYSGRFTQYIVKCNEIMLKVNFENNDFQVGQIINLKIKQYNVL